jgi:hypothetical protein
VCDRQDLFQETLAAQLDTDVEALEAEDEARGLLERGGLEREIGDRLYSSFKLPKTISSLILILKFASPY